MKTSTQTETTLPSILLVEDEKIVQVVHMAMLKKLHCNVDLAETGQEALEKYDKHYALILMDIGLPDMRGTTVTAKMKSLALDIPIIALTAYSYEEIADECLAAGVDAIYHKPLMPGTLTQILQKYGHINI